MNKINEIVCLCSERAQGSVKMRRCFSRRFFRSVSDDIIQSHLMGRDLTKRSNKDFTIGVYPLLSDETCWFLAVDFDKESWVEDSKIYLETCRSFDVPAALERSRSGNGGHIWIFFTETIPAKLAHQLGAFMVTQTMEKRPEIGFESYNRFFPSQDTMPKGGFGNLIALYDYADFGVPMLERMYERRRRGYRAIGYEIEQ